MSAMLPITGNDQVFAILRHPMLLLHVPMRDIQPIESVYKWVIIIIESDVMCCVVPTLSCVSCRTRISPGVNLPGTIVTARPLGGNDGRLPKYRCAISTYVYVIMALGEVE
jgi:hypothetical protein